MKLVVKSLNRDEMKRIKKKDIKVIDTKTDIFDGKIALLMVYEVEPLIIKYPYGDIKILDNNYKWLEFAPRNSNYWLTVMFDENDNLIESYFDITKDNVIDIDNPYFIDIFLDVVIRKDKKIYLLDENEINDALKNNIITELEYKNSFDTANEIISYYNKNKDEFYNKIYYYFNLLK